MLSLKERGFPMNEVLFAGTLFSVKQNEPFGLHVRHTGGW